MTAYRALPSAYPPLIDVVESPRRSPLARSFSVDTELRLLSLIPSPDPRDQSGYDTHAQLPIGKAHRTHDRHDNKPTRDTKEAIES